MPRITYHSKQRLVQRADTVNNFLDAEKAAKLAWKSGNTINNYQSDPDFFVYLVSKRNQTNSCCIRVYKNNIFIYRGKGKHRGLVTSYPIPERFRKEVNENV